MKLLKMIRDIEFHGSLNIVPIINSTNYGLFDLKSLCFVGNTNGRYFIKKYSKNYFICTHSENPEQPYFNWIYFKLPDFEQDLFHIQKRYENKVCKHYSEGMKVFIVWATMENYISCMDLDDKSLWVLHGFSAHYVHEYNDKILIIQATNNHIVLCVNVNNGEVEWSLDISKIGERILPNGKVEQGKVHSPMVKLCENIAVIPILSWGTIGIDISTGSILWKLNDPSTYINYQYNQYFYSVGDNIIEFDATTGKILRTKPIAEILDMLNEEIRYATLSIQGVSISEKYIIYGNRGYVWVINRLTLELIETVEIDAQGSVYSGSPLYHEGKLYIVDGYGHLHVIEDENADLI